MGNLRYLWHKCLSPVTSQLKLIILKIILNVKNVKKLRAKMTFQGGIADISTKHFDLIDGGLVISKLIV